MKNEQPLEGKILTPTFLICSLIFLISLIFMAKRFIYGLGAVTNLMWSSEPLSDAAVMPWPFWSMYSTKENTTP
jgi:Ni/Fe-hydrogenase subunit HybB-like protein